jgi:hypothetical protein
MTKFKNSAVALTAAASLGALMLASAPALARGFGRGESMAQFAEVAAREQQGFLNHRFDQQFDFLAQRFPAAKDELGLDSRVFVGSQKLILSRAQDTSDSASIPSAFGNEFPVSMFSLFRNAVGAAFQNRLGLDQETSLALADALEKQAVEAAKVDYGAYSQAVGRFAAQEADAQRLFQHALSALSSNEAILTGCDIPFVAGYSIDAQAVYIDRSIPTEKSFNGTVVPMAKLLNIHERVEKAILDEFGSSYPHAHQIALRVEKLAANAISVPWQPYDAYWDVAAAAMDSKSIVKVPRDLDMTPYLTFTDSDSIQTVRRMKRAQVDVSQCRKSDRTALSREPTRRRDSRVKSSSIM